MNPLGPTPTTPKTTAPDVELDLTDNKVDGESVSIKLAKDDLPGDERSNIEIRDQTNRANPAKGNDYAVAISEHIESKVGAVAGVFEEKLFDSIKVEVQVVQPTVKRNFFTLITSGMSSRPMTTTNEYSNYQYCELMLCLPADWEMDASAPGTGSGFWPVRWLQQIAKLPHKNRSWVWDGHTIPNQNTFSPDTANQTLSSALLLKPAMFDDDFCRLRIDSAKTVYFHSVLPLYKAETDFRAKHGVQNLVKRLRSAGVTELLDPNRAPVTTTF